QALGVADDYLARGWGHGQALGHGRGDGDGGATGLPLVGGVHGGGVAGGGISRDRDHAAIDADAVGGVGHGPGGLGGDVFGVAQRHFGGGGQVEFPGGGHLGLGRFHRDGGGLVEHHGLRRDGVVGGHHAHVVGAGLGVGVRDGAVGGQQFVGAAVVPHHVHRVVVLPGEVGGVGHLHGDGQVLGGGGELRNDQGLGAAPRRGRGERHLVGVEVVGVVAAIGGEHSRAAEAVFNRDQQVGGLAVLVTGDSPRASATPATDLGAPADGERGGPVFQRPALGRGRDHPRQQEIPARVNGKVRVGVHVVFVVAPGAPAADLGPQVQRETVLIGHALPDAEPGGLPLRVGDQLPGGVHQGEDVRVDAAKLNRHVHPLDGVGAFLADAQRAIAGLAAVVLAPFDLGAELHRHKPAAHGGAARVVGRASAAVQTGDTQPARTDVAGTDGGCQCWRGHASSWVGGVGASSGRRGRVVGTAAASHGQSTTYTRSTSSSPAFWRVSNVPVDQVAGSITAERRTVTGRVAYSQSASLVCPAGGAPTYPAPNAMVLPSGACMTGPATDVTDVERSRPEVQRGAWITPWPPVAAASQCSSTPTASAGSSGSVPAGSCTGCSAVPMRRGTLPTRPRSTIASTAVCSP